jgi:flagellar basal body-associated protein FliL
MSVHGNNYFKKEVSIMKILLISILILIMLPAVVRAAPFLYNPIPLNNSIFSGGEIDFRINITESDLNTSSAVLHIISQDAYIQNESWENYSMSCTNYLSGEWNCSKKISFPIVGSDTIELFYFEAKDNSGNIGLNGTSNISQALRFSLDRKAPMIEFVNPKNSTWVSGIETIEINVYDALTGVNYSTVNYSFDRINWFNTTKSTYFTAVWNTTSLANNQTVTIYARASDNVNNANETSINVTVDNELPQIRIISPSQSQNLKLAATFSINAIDLYSGMKSASFSIGGITESMDCSGNVSNYTCTKLFDTFRISDGTYTLNFSATDNAGNTNTTSVQVEISNIKSAITINYPYNNSQIRNITTIRASLSDPLYVNDVRYLVNKAGNILENNSMSCSWDYSSCTANLNTTKYADGEYILLVKSVSNQRGILANSSIVVIFNNTPIATGSTINITINQTSTNAATNQTDQGKNKTNETNQTSSNPIQKLSTNFKIIIIVTVVVLAAVSILIIALRGRRKKEKPWYESISDY